MFRVIAILLALLTTPLHAATVQPESDPFDVVYMMPQWSSVGHDTCKQNPGCTADWAMTAFAEKGVLPVSIAEQAREAFLAADALVQNGETPNWQTYEVCEGDVVASSFSNSEGKLTTVSQIKATFAGCTPGLGWTFYDPQTQQSYQVFRVTECGNYTVRVVSVATGSYLSTPLTTALITDGFNGAHRGFGGGIITNTPIVTVVNEYCTIFCAPTDVPVDYNPNPNPNPVTPSPVPLSSSGILLILSLLTLSTMAYRKKRTQQI